MRIVSLISVFLLFSCSTMLLDKKKYNYEDLQNERSFIHIDLNEQKLYYQDGNRVIDFPISSSRKFISSSIITGASPPSTRAYILFPCFIT